jgi:hypothetical protein
MMGMEMGGDGRMDGVCEREIERGREKREGEGGRGREREGEKRGCQGGKMGRSDR